MRISKSVSILLIPYFTVCSGLYHVAFWDTFNLNGLAYIGISDLIKSFIYPFLTFGLTIFIGIIIVSLLTALTKYFQVVGAGRLQQVKN